MAALHPQLDALLRSLDEATARAQQLAGSATDAAFSARPAEASWSAAECLAHLCLTTEAIVPLIDAALAAAPAVPARAGHRYRRSVIGWLLCWVLEPPPRRGRTRTPPPFVPVATQSREAQLAAFAAGQHDLAARIRAIDGRDVRRARLVSPFNAKVRYDVYSALCVVLAHERRHLWQAAQALSQYGSQIRP